MKLSLYSILILIAAIVSGCATFGQMESGLNSLMGRNETEAFSVLGYPSGKQQFGSDTVYIWEVSNTGTLLLPQTATTYGTVGTIPVYGTTTYNQAVPINNSCLIKIAADSDGTLKNWEYKGNLGGCKNYISRLDSYNKLRNPETTEQGDVTLDEKKRWAKLVSELNGCNKPTKVVLSKKEGEREFFDVSCTNKSMEIQCEFIGPVFTGLKGLPFVKVSGKSYDNQPACWQ